MVKLFPPPATCIYSQPMKELFAENKYFIIINSPDVKCSKYTRQTKLCVKRRKATTFFLTHTYSNRFQIAGKGNRDIDTGCVCSSMSTRHLHTPTQPSTQTSEPASTNVVEMCKDVRVYFCFLLQHETKWLLPFLQVVANNSKKTKAFLLLIYVTSMIEREIY